MPKHFKALHPAARGYTLGDAANDKTILVVRCTTCRRTGHYLAIDLVKVFPDKADHPFRYPLFPCGNCKSAEFIRIELRFPTPGDHGNLTVRRPGEVKHIQTWHDAKLGD